MRTKRKVIVLMMSVLVALIAAAGVSAADPAAAQVAGGGYVKKCGGGEIFLDEEEKRAFVLHNEVRREHNLPAFCVHPKLQRAARSHSKDMLDRDYASHTSPDGETVRERLKRFGYDFSGCSYYAYGENIAWGCGSRGAPDRIFRWWMNSSKHKSNILNKKFREIGIGVRTGTYKSCDHATMYTVDFGTRRR
jgi:uncharacterized protein YkwD